MADTARTILIIEDDKLLSTLIADKLKNGNYKTTLARTGEDGLATAFKEHPDLILLDILLVEMDGMGFLTKIREDEWGKEAPVIILTNLSDAVVIREAEKLGVHSTDYLKKSETDLSMVLERVNERLKTAQG